MDCPHTGGKGAECGDQLKRRTSRVRTEIGADHAAQVRALVECRVSAQRANLVTFSAAGPFCPCTTSNSTRSPSTSDLKPPPWMADWWTKQSFSPSSRV